MFIKFLKRHFLISSFLLSLIGVINYIVDPLWYNQGNKINQVNLAVNERLSKTNLYLDVKNTNYDCFIFGSSRVTLLNSNSLKNNKCFNYAFSGGTIEEFVKYAEFVKQKGASPKKIYLGIDAFNFDPKNKIAANVVVPQPKPIFQPYLFSSDNLNFSIRAIRGDYNLPRFYDREFQAQIIDNAPEYKPKLSKSISNEACNLSRIDSYKKLRNIFPQAEFISYVAPISPWWVYNKSYSRGLMQCQLQGIHQVSRFFDKMYDFSYPSPITTNLKNTYDGSHFYPQVNDKIAEILEGKQSNYGIRVDKMNLDRYQEFYRKRLKEFLDKQGREELWRG
jgi:hypothetical protein